MLTGWDPHMRLLTINETAASTGRPASTIRRWVSEGRLTSHAWLNTPHGRRDLYLEADALAVDAATRRTRSRKKTPDRAPRA